MGSGGGTAFAVPLSDADLQTLASQIQQINDTSDSATASETPSAQADAVEGWTIDSNIAQGGEILEMANGWLHLKSTASNGNAAANPSSSNNWPAVAVWGTDYDFSKAGSFHATIKSPQEGSANRFGFYLGYNDPGSACSSATIRTAGSGRPTPVAVAAAGTAVLVSLLRAPTKSTTFRSPGPTPSRHTDRGWPEGIRCRLLRNDEPLQQACHQGRLLEGAEPGHRRVHQGLPGGCRSRQARGFRQGCGRWSAAIEGATVRLDKTKVKTGADGTFSFADIEEGEHTLSIAKEGYEDVSQQVTVSGADLAIDPITLNKTVQVASETLKTKKMEVQIKKNFPSVLQYTMTDAR